MNYLIFILILVQISHFHYSTFNESNGTSIEIPCNLQLKDYTDLLLTTVAEFPGKVKISAKKL